MTQDMVYLGEFSLALEKYIYYVLRCSVLQMFIRSFWLMVLFNSSIFLLIFCLIVLSIAENYMLKLPTIIVDLSIPLFSFVSFAYFDALMFGAYTFWMGISSWWINFFIIMYLSSWWINLLPLCIIPLSP